MLIKICSFVHVYSASNLERPLLCFVFNNNVLCYKKVTIIAIRLEFGPNFHTSLLNMFGKFYVFLLSDYEVVAAYVPSVDLQFIKNVLGPGKEN